MSNRLEFLIFPVRSFCRYQYYYRVSPVDSPPGRSPDAAITTVPDANYKARLAGFQPAPYDPRRIHLDLLHQLDRVENVRIQGRPFYEILQYDRISLWQFVAQASFRYSLLDLAEITECLCVLIERYAPKNLRLQGCFGEAEAQVVRQIAQKYRLLQDFSHCRIVSWEQLNPPQPSVPEPSPHSQSELRNPAEIIRYLSSTFPKRAFPSDQKTVLLTGFARSWWKVSEDQEIDIYYDAFLDCLNKNRIKAVRLELPYYCYVDGDMKEYIDQVRREKRGGLPTIFFDEYYGNEIHNRFGPAKQLLGQLYQWYSRQQDFQSAFCSRGISLFEPLEISWKRDLTEYLLEVVSQLWVAKKIIREVRPAGMFFYYEVGSYARALTIESNRAGIPTVGLLHAPIFSEQSYYSHRNVSVGPDAEKRFVGNIIPRKTVVYGSEAKQILTERNCYPEDAVVVAGRDWRFFSRQKVKQSKQNLDQLRRHWFSGTKKIALLVHSGRWEGMEDLMAKKLDPSEYSILIKLHPSFVMLKDGSCNLNSYFRDRGFETCLIVDYLDDAIALADLIFLPIKTTAAMHCLEAGKGFYYYEPVPPSVTILWKAFGINMEQADCYKPICYSQEQKQEIRLFLKSMGYDETVSKDHFDSVVQKLLDDLQITDRTPENKDDGISNGRSSQNDLVSVITPFHNMEKTITETIESVLLQSYKNWEMILVDDGSSDNSGRIAEQYARRYPDRIRLIAHEGRINAGASASRNLAFSHSRGRYIAYLDADDLWLPDKLSFEIKLLREHPEAGMVMSPVRYFYENPRADQTDYDQDLSTLREGLYPAPTLCMEFLKNFGVSACPSATLIRREVVEWCPWEIPFRRNFTDQVFWAKVTSSTAVYVTKRIVTCYRQHENSSWEIAHRDHTYAEQNDKFWSWAARFSDQFTQNPQFQTFLLETCIQKLTDQAKADYLRSRKTLASLSGTTLEDGVCWVNYKAQRWLDRNIIPGMKVFEFGSGGSTVYFLNKGCRLTTVEHDPDWYEKVKQKLNCLHFGDFHTYILQPPQPSVPGQERYFSGYPGYESLSFEKYVRTIDGYENGSFDVVFVDGRACVDCIRHAASKLKQGGFLILDNAERERYRLVYSILAGYSIQDFYGFGPYEPEVWQTLVFTKPSDPAAGRNRPVLDRESHSMESQRSLMMNVHLKELYNDIYPEPLNEVHQIGTLQCLREYKDLFSERARILDVGCGQGFAMRQMKQMGLDPVGITLGEEDYQCCRQQGLDVRKMDMSFMEAFETGSFDGLFVRHSLEHSPMPVITLMEFWRVLKPNGWVILVVPSPDAVIYPNHYSLFEPPVWANLAGTASFQVESFRSVGQYSFADRKIPREYPEYQFVLRKREKQNSRMLTEKNLEFVKRLTAQTPIDPISENHNNKINFGSLRRLSPVSRLFGSDRMTGKSLPLCWYYIRRFLAEHAGDIRGQVLEIGDNTYTRMFGGNRITKSDVLHAVPGNKAATVVADLTKADNIPSDAFDCIICTQTLQCIYDVRAAVRNLYRILKPGGVLLVSGSGISQISRYDMDRWGEYWRFTTASFKKLFEEYWPQESIEVQSFGNILVATAYLQGLVSGDLDENEINFHDDDYQMIILGRAVKPVKPAKRILDHTPQVRNVQPDPADVQKAGSAEPDEVRMIADGWDQYAREWNSGKFKVLSGHQVKNIGDEWTAEDVGGGGTTYGLPKDIVDHFDEYINQRLLNAYLPFSADEGLEIGPGGGRLTNLLVHRTRLLHLADSSDTMLGKLKERFANQAHLRYYHTDGLSLPPLRKASLDYVIAFDVFVHFEPRLVYWYLRQISQLLKPGGVCILHYANAMTEIGWTQFESDLKMNIRRREYFASFGTMCPQLMEKFLASLGIEIHSVDTGLIPRDAVAVFSKPVKVSSGDESVLPVLRSRSIQDSVTVSRAGRNPSIVPAENIRGKSNESLTMPLVLLYHRVAEDELDSELLAVSPANFREHLNTLKERCRVVPLRQLLEEGQAGRAVPDTVALTFDDGYLDNLTGALPLLEQYGMHATVFITADNIQRTTGFWWDKLESLFLGNHRLPEQLDINEKDQNYKWRLDTPRQRLLAYDQLAAILRSKPVHEIETFVSALFQWAQIQEGPASCKPVLSLLQLQQLSQSPCIEIGSHTLSHTRLSMLPPGQQEKEIIESKKKLEFWTGRPVTILSYPYGTSADYTEQTKALVRQAGYQYGIANSQGSVGPNTDPFEVPRRLVRNWPGPVFAQWMQAENKGLLEQQTIEQREGIILWNYSSRSNAIPQPLSEPVLEARLEQAVRK